MECKCRQHCGCLSKHTENTSQPASQQPCRNWHQTTYRRRELDIANWTIAVRAAEGLYLQAKHTRQLRPRGSALRCSQTHFFVLENSGSATSSLQRVNGLLLVRTHIWTKHTAVAPPKQGAKLICKARLQDRKALLHHDHTCCTAQRP